MRFKKFIPIILVIISAALLRFPFLSREFVLEEALNVKDAIAISQKGYPVVYMGEQAPQSIHLDRTPGLFFFEAISFKLLGVSEESARLVPLLFSFGQLFLIYYFSLKFFKNRHLSLFSAILFATNPYIIQNSTHIHYDGAVFAFFSTWYLFLACQKIISHQNKWQDHIKLAILFFFALFVKYDPTLIMLFVVTIFSAIYWRPFLKKLFLSSFLSASLFLGLFYLYNNAFNHPEAFFQPFLWIFEVFSQKLTASSASISQFLWSDNYYLLIRFLSWLSIPLIFLTAYAIFWIGKEKTLKKDPRIVFLCLWLFSFCFVYLAFGWSGDFPRYFAPAIPPLFLIIAITLKGNLAKSKKVFTKAAIMAFLTALSIFLFLAYRNWLFLDRITGWIPHLQIPFFAITIIGILAIIITHSNKNTRITLTLTLIFLYFFQIIAQNIHDLKSPYSLTNFYGYGGYREAGQFLKNQFHQNNLILTFDPVAYYWQGEYVDFNLFGTLHSGVNFSLITDLLSQGSFAAIALPDIYLKELENASSTYKLDYQTAIKTRFKNHVNFGGVKGIEVYY